jgi:hypothetical protein
VLKFLLSLVFLRFGRPGMLEEWLIGAVERIKLEFFGVVKRRRKTEVLRDVV